MNRQQHNLRYQSQRGSGLESRKVRTMIRCRGLRGRTSLGDLASAGVFETEEDLGDCFRASMLFKTEGGAVAVAVAVLSSCALGIGSIAPRSLARLAAATDSGRNSLTSGLLAQPDESSSGNVATKFLKDGS